MPYHTGFEDRRQRSILMPVATGEAMALIKVYGLKDCDTCRKALAWLKQASIAHQFVDVRADGLTVKDIKRFADAVGVDVLLNKASTTWRGLDDGEKADLSKPALLKLIAANPALMKRPVFDCGDRIVVGFRAAQQAELAACV